MHGSDGHLPSAALSCPHPPRQVLSLDALNGVEARADGEEWVWGGYDLLDEGGGRSLWDRALLFLSPGGTDATVVREFDLGSSSFVEGGFCTTSPAKCEVGFRRRDEVLIGTDFDGTGASLTDSGYPRVIKSWRRGTPLESAVTVFEVGKGDISASQYAYHDRGGAVHEFQLRAVSFYQTEQFYRTPDLRLAAADDPTPFRKVPIPDDTSLGTFGEEATLLLRSAWAPPKAPGGREYAAGTLLAAPLEHVMQGDWSAATVLFEPHADGSTSLQAHTCCGDTCCGYTAYSLWLYFLLQGYSATANYLVLETSRHVRAELGFWRHGPTGWSREAGGGGGGGGGGVAVPVGESVGVRAIWPDDSDDVWLDRAGFLRPATLEMASASDACAHAQPLKALPAMFDASGHACTQHFATSADGTQVPYFLLAPKDMPLDSTHPTLLDGYGGFEISLTPAYSGGLGAAWLARGGVKAIANIRGGGEYGPRWHQAALREKRHKAYEDFEAVARDLVSRGVTAPERLGCIGGSNGGLLTGNMLTREGRALFGAIVCQVPLLDMRRYHKLLAGASWMEEYGNPDEPGVWEGHLASISPYERLRGAPCLGTDGAGAGTLCQAAPSLQPCAPNLQPCASSLQSCASSLQPHVSGAAWEGCPRVLFTTSTKDDRVHPGHARKMVKVGICNAHVMHMLCTCHAHTMPGACNAHAIAMHMPWSRRCTTRCRSPSVAAPTTCCTGRTSRAATAAPPTTSSARTCGRSRTTSCGRASRCGRRGPPAPRRRPSYPRSTRSMWSPSKELLPEELVSVRGREEA